jgi:hypothetical protein
MSRRRTEEEEARRRVREANHNAWGILILIAFFVFIFVMAAIEQFPNFIRYVHRIWVGG